MGVSIWEGRKAERVAQALESMAEGNETHVIDDGAGVGDTDRTWSANKIATELDNKIQRIENAGMGNLVMIGYQGVLVNGPTVNAFKIHRYSFTLGSNTGDTPRMGLSSNVWSGDLHYGDNDRLIGYELSDSSKVISVNYTINEQSIEISYVLAPGATDVTLDMYIAHTY